MKHRQLDRRALEALAALAVAAGGAGLLAGCGGSGSSGGSSTASTTTAGGKFDAAGELKPVRGAPALALRNNLGQPVNLASYKGKAVLVTFLYTHCPDVCPLIASNLRVALNLMGPTVASKVQLIAVSVDPRGDTNKAVTSFLARHQVTGRMQYLVGSSHELGKVWEAWGVGSERDAERPEFINHSGLIYGITASGKRVTVYAANFEPKAIAHDVPLLAAR